MRSLKLLLVLLVCAAAVPAVAYPGEEAGKALQNGDYTTAARLYRPLADQGDPLAQASLGIIYAAGLGVPQDYEAAMVWYRKAAEQGHATGLFGLGDMYFQGHGVPRDFMQAYIWFSLAASQLDAEDANSHGQFRNDAAMARQSRNEAAAKMTPAQIAEAQKLAREWRPKRAQ